MIVDSSALVAILLQEPSAAFCSEALQGATAKRMSAANYLEASVVIDSGVRSRAGHWLDELLAESEIAIEPFTEQQARIARRAYREFGKGSGHPAKLNFGDCFAYALAKDKREPLLCVGNDFVHTDIPTICPE